MDRRVTLFLIVDRSDSMKGQGLGSVNDTAANLVLHFKECVASNSSNEGIIKVIGVDDRAQLLASSNSASCIWKDVEGAGLTNIGEVYKYLNYAIDISSTNVIILISDGGFTDDYCAHLSALMDNPAFNNAIRLSIAVNSDYDRGQLEYFCGMPDHLVDVSNIDKALNIISRLV